MTLTSLTGPTIQYASDPGRRRYRLLHSMVHQDETGAVYGIPAGFECDGATIPWFLPETGPCEAAGFGHDFAYRFGFVYRWDSEARLWTRKPITRAWADAYYAALCGAYDGNRAWAQTQRGALRIWPGTLLIWWRHRRAAKVWAGPEPTTAFATENPS